MIKAIVFSRNRACQLDLLLHSVQEFVEHSKLEIAIIYQGTNPNFVQGYQVLKQNRWAFPITWIEQKDFRQDTLAAMNTANSYSTFLVDDDVFKEPWHPAEKLDRLNDPEMLCVSLRIAPNYNYCYPRNATTPPPVFTADLVWHWPTASGGDWSYPMSLDGHVFRTNDIRPLVGTLSFTNPNTLEANLSGHPLNRPKMVCFSKSKLVNIPVNRVQTLNQNRSGLEVNFPVDHLNNAFLQGKRLRLPKVANRVYNACHQEIPLVLQ